jgi:iron complex transport system ATP-binding protein
MSDGQDILLEAEHIDYRAGNTDILHNICLQLRPGELLGLIGPNGAGKSTLLKLLTGLLPADSGRVRIRGENTRFMTPLQRAHELAYLEQNPQTHWPLNVRQIVSLGRLPYGHISSATNRDAVWEALLETDLQDFVERSFDTLSAGEKLRVHLARMLATQTPILLADEPVASLDLWHQYQTMEQLRKLSGNGKGIIVVMHDLGLAARYCSRLLLLRKGRLVAEGNPAEVLTQERVADTYGVKGWYDQDNREFRMFGRLAEKSQGAA